MATDKPEKRLIGARVDPEFAERVEAAAVKDDRTVAQFVRQALARALEPKTEQRSAAA